MASAVSCIAIDTIMVESSSYVGAYLDGIRVRFPARFFLVFMRLVALFRGTFEFMLDKQVSSSERNTDYRGREAEQV